MPKWEVKQPLDYSATGDDIDSASQKLIATLNDVYEKLNRLRTMDADALHSAADPMPFTWKIDTSIDPPAILIRNADNTDYIQVGSVTEKMGITASDMGAITGDGMKKLSLGAEQDLPATAETYDMYFAYDTARVYIFHTGSWRKFLSLRFEDLLGVGDSVVEQEEVTTGAEPNKVPRLNEVGQGAFDITGSAAKIGGKNLFLPEIPDGSVLVFNATRDRWEVAPRDDIKQSDVSTTGEPNKIIKADANGAIANDTKGSAAKIATKTIDVSNLQDGDVLVYDATYGTFKNKQGAVVNAQGVVEANVSGSAAKWGGKTIQTVNMVDGQILVWSESNQAFVNRNQGTVGTGRALVINQDYEEKANYNGDNYRMVNIITPHLRVASQEYAVGTTCFSKNMPNTTYLECVTAGVTAATEPDMSSAAIGDVVADGGVEWKVCGYVNTEVTDSLRTDLTSAQGDITDIQTELASNNRKPSTTYAENDIRYYSGLPVGWYLECTTGGITDSGDITLPSPVVENATVTDGTVTWTVRKQASNAVATAKNRKPDTLYNESDMAYLPTLPAGWYLLCTTGGTTSSNELIIRNPNIGDTVTDGTVEWQIKSIASSGGSGADEVYHEDVITTSGTYIVPATALYKITLLGGGGGGGTSGAASATYSGGSGGGGGGGEIVTSYKTLVAGSAVSVVIGAGGNGYTRNYVGTEVTQASDGGTTSVTIGPDTISAVGGKAGGNGGPGNDNTYGGGPAGVGGAGGSSGAGIAGSNGQNGHIGVTKSAGCIIYGGQGGGNGGDALDLPLNPSYTVRNTSHAGGNGWVKFEYYTTV